MTRRYLARTGISTPDQLLDGLGIAQGVTECASTANTLGDVNELVVVLGLAQTLQTTMNEADLWNALKNLLCPRQQDRGEAAREEQGAEDRKE